MSFARRSTRFVARTYKGLRTPQLLFTRRNYSFDREIINQKDYDYPEERQVEKDEVIQRLIRYVLISREHEDPKHISERLRWITATIQNEEDFIYTVQQAARVAARLKLEGYPDVGYIQKKPVARVAVTGAGGQIGYSLVPRIASGEMFGPQQPVFLHLIDLPGDSMKRVKGLAYEIEDCAFPLLRGIRVTSNMDEGFKDVDYAIFVGSKPRGKGMQRADLVKENGPIFVDTGKALAKNAKKSVLSLVVGNPANTNCLVLASNAKGIPAEQFTALTRLDQDRAIAQLAKKANVSANEIEDMNIWGNHSDTMFPDYTNAKIGGKPATEAIQDLKWFENDFVPLVAKRGAAIINARGASSAASAADAAVKHMRDWVLGTNGKTVSMAVSSDGSYNVEKGLYSSFPVICHGDGKYEVVKNLKLDKKAQEKIQGSIAELSSEKKSVASLLK